MAYIQTEDGLELFITANHPLESSEGLRCAAFLSNGDGDGRLHRKY